MNLGLDTFEDLKTACANVGVNLECPACAEIFYTGSTVHSHECSRSDSTDTERSVSMTYQEAFEMKRKLARWEAEQTRRKFLLCGSGSIQRLTDAWFEALTISGHEVVLPVDFQISVPEQTWYSSEEANVPEDKDAWFQAERYLRIEESAMRQLQDVDGLVVLNLDGDIEANVHTLIEEAYKLEKMVYFLESWGKRGGKFRQPISSVAGLGGHRLNREVWVTDLLGPASRLRSRLVYALCETKKRPRYGTQPAPGHLVIDCTDENLLYRIERNALRDQVKAIEVARDKEGRRSVFFQKSNLNLVSDGGMYGSPVWEHTS